MEIRSILASCLLFVATVLPAAAQGTINIALAQQVNSNGQPLIGCLLYIYQAGTVATPQNAFTDTGLTFPLPNPMSCDANGRLPMFYLASGSVHVRLTDASGIVQFDYPSMLVVGPAGGGGGGGGTSVDPTTVASTGDIKFRPTSEVLAGWVKINALTIGSPTSGASGRANNDTQALYLYLWTNCPNAHCPVLTGRGASGLADFGANKQLTLPDWRARIPVGLDDMGNVPAGILLPGNVTSGGGDLPTTPGATGGEANHTMTVPEMPAHNHVIDITDPGHSHAMAGSSNSAPGARNSFENAVNVTNNSFPTSPAATGITAASENTGGGSSHNVMNTFTLGSWYMKL